ncbi:MAG: phage terminase large subunit [Shewanella sp.]
MAILDDFSSLTMEQRIAIRRLSLSNFMTFTKVWFNILQGSKFMENWHHHVFCDAIDDIIYKRRQNRNLVINCPPGSTKTELFSIHAPAYSAALVSDGRVSKFRNLNLSFSDALTTRNSIRTRDIIASQEFQSLFDSKFGVNQASEWSLIDNRGKVICETISRSVGGQVTGARGGYIGPEYSGHLSLDDPDKPSDTLSEVKRKRQHDFMTNTVRSRRGDKSKDNATPIICIAQRTHVDDTSGFLLSGGMGVKFDHIKIPALVTEDYVQGLPDKYKDLCWRDIKDTESVVVAGQRYWSFWGANEDIGQLLELWNQDEYVFLSQYMQEPISLGGSIFKSDWFRLYGDSLDEADEVTPPYFEYRFTTADTATKTGTRNDFSVMCEWGVYLGNLYLINMVRGKWEAPELEANFRAFIGDSWQKNQRQELGNLRAVLVEDKASGTGLIQTVGRNSPVPITPIQRSIDKLTRGMDTAPHVKAGKVRLPANASWLVEFMAEHATFTGEDGKNKDDMVDNTMDAVSYALIKNTSLFDIIYR